MEASKEPILEYDSPLTPKPYGKKTEATRASMGVSDFGLEFRAPKTLNPRTSNPRTLNPKDHVVGMS